MTQAFETENTKQASEDELSKRYLRFLAWQLERATKDPEWNGQLKEMAEQFAERENRT